MHRTPRSVRAVLAFAALSAPAWTTLVTAPSAGAAASPTAFCAKVKAHNKTVEAFVRKTPSDRNGLAKLRVQGWTALAASAPPPVATGLRNMAAALKQSFPPAPADMGAVLPYIEQNCKVRLG